MRKVRSVRVVKGKAPRNATCGAQTRTTGPGGLVISRLLYQRAEGAEVSIRRYRLVVAPLSVYGRLVFAR